MKTRQKDPALMTRIEDFVGEYYRKTQRAPSCAEIAAALGIGKTTAYTYLVEMDRLGRLSYRSGEIRSVNKIERSRGGYFSAPLVGSVKCGDPEQEEQHVELYASLPESIFGKGDFYLLRASGDSMVDAGISDGDLVLIRKQHDCEPGDMVVALDENNENTLKTYAGTDAESGCAVLRYENREKYPDARILVRCLTVQGVVSSIIKLL